MARALGTSSGVSTLPSGSLTVISGKTEELIRRALYARCSVQVFKHALDTRSEFTEIRSHNGVLHEAVAVSTGEERVEPAPASAPTILVGAEESYEARCRHCHEVP